jgi:adenylate kinase family enzyme
MPTDQVPEAAAVGMRRVAVVGPSASGKSTLAHALAGRLGVPHLELDSVYHQADWTPLPKPEFRSRVSKFVEQDGWVIDGNYTSNVGDLVLERADTVVWLRMPRGLVLRQVLRRTALRLLSRQPLWNGNRETLRNVLSRDPERSIVTWAWVMHDKYDESYESLLASAPPDQQWVVLRSRADVGRFLGR